MDSPVVANYYIEKFQQKALHTTTDEQKCWFRYVKDTFVIWPYGNHKLQQSQQFPWKWRKTENYPF